MTAVVEEELRPCLVWCGLESDIHSATYPVGRAGQAGRRYLYCSRECADAGRPLAKRPKHATEVTE